MTARGLLFNQFLQREVRDLIHQRTIYPSIHKIAALSIMTGSPREIA
jgi:hypothetical protein